MLYNISFTSGACKVHVTSILSSIFRNPNSYKKASTFAKYTQFEVQLYITNCVPLLLYLLYMYICGTFRCTEFTEQCTFQINL